MFEQKIKHWYLYVLLCENNKYYIGITLDLAKRIDIHFRQLSSSSYFCKKYKPIKILGRKDLGLLTQRDAEFKENVVTCDYIDKYGFNNVCGGGFAPYYWINKNDAKSIMYNKNKFSRIRSNKFLYKSIRLMECQTPDDYSDKILRIERCERGVVTIDNFS